MVWLVGPKKRLLQPQQYLTTMETIRTFLEQQSLLSMFLVIALGYAIGAVNIRGFNLGIGAVLFVGLGRGRGFPTS